MGTTVFSVRVPSEWMPLIDEACEGNRNGWLLSLIEPALTQRPVKFITAPGEDAETIGRALAAGWQAADAVTRVEAGETVREVLTKPSTTESMLAGDEAGTVRNSRLTARGRTTSPDPVAAESVADTSKSTPKYLVRGSYNGTLWSCSVDGTDIRFSCPSKRSIEAKARQFLVAHTGGNEFTVEVK